MATIKPVNRAHCQTDLSHPSKSFLSFNFVLTNPFMFLRRKTLQTILAVIVLAQSTLSSDHALQVRRMNRHRNIHPRTAPKTVCARRSSASPTTHCATTTSTVHQTPTPVSDNASHLTPNGIKAGIAGGDAYPFLKDHIGWWYDWWVSFTKSSDW